MNIRELVERCVVDFLIPSAPVDFPALNDESPLRAELFSADQMEQHGKSLAAAHRLSTKPRRDRMLSRLAANEAVLVKAREVLNDAVRADRRITPAGEWLLDNFYLIEEQVRTAKRHLPKHYSRELPQLANGPSAGLPRMYDIALETIAHGDGRVDPESLSRFVAAYQSVTAVTLGELWAIPIMLRLALIENLRRVAIDVAAGRADRDMADGWVERMMATARTDPKSLILVIADMARSDPPMTTAFVSELSRLLRGHGPALALPLTWVEQRLSESHQTVEQLIHAGTQQQAANQVSVSNSIGSLRFLGAMNWRNFVESMSVVDRTLRDDPDGTYTSMDFATRDSYRHAVEQIARRSPLGEAEVAEVAVRLARENRCGNVGDARASHVGFYLVAAGRPALERAVAMRSSWRVRLSRVVARKPVAIYLASIAFLTAALAGAWLLSEGVGGTSGAVLGLIAATVVLGTSQLAVTLVNWLVTLLVMPTALPRLDFAEGLPATSHTLVVVPAMLASVAGIADLVDALEVRFLANQDANLHFALLTDFLDAPAAAMAPDAALLRAAQERIVALNVQYRAAAPGSGHAAGPFYLFHRPRRWNAREGTWMGYERKRGKLAELNAFLRGAAEASARFESIVGDTTALARVRYVITLDSDTELPRDAARQLVGAMAHPLNRPQYSEARGRMIAGYGILQPRVVTNLTGSNRSRYARLFGGESGIDPYTRAVSDVYQDAFGQGSFIGKGIYDVDAFEQALKGRFPENRVLSHDLLEGAYARAGLITDVQLYDDFPCAYGSDVSRRRRWIRGDWQVAGWLRSRVPAAAGQSNRNDLCLLSQWKLLDNLRRSLVAPAMLVLFVLGWTLPVPAWRWTASVLAIPVIPALLMLVKELVRKARDTAWRQHLDGTLRGGSERALQIVFTVACLPYEVSFSLDAILRTHWRVLVSQTRLLEWVASSEIDHSLASASLAAYVRRMWIAPTFAAGLAAYLYLSRPGSLVVAAPLLLLWFAAPASAWWISRPHTPRAPKLAPEMQLFLRKLARRTWAYFETFVGPDDNWLPPDNYQEVPVGTVAHRTSPTNIGVALLADLAAHDFGYLPAGRLLSRVGSTFKTMQSLDRYEGHFYNWYDTRSLQPLAPRYISSVDSGNLVGHLLTLRVGIAELASHRILEPRFFIGLSDTAFILVESLGSDVPATASALLRQVGKTAANPPDTLAAADLALDEIRDMIRSVATDIKKRTDSSSASNTEPAAWIAALAAQCASGLEELADYAPWLHDRTLDEVIAAFPMLAPIPTLTAVVARMPTLAIQMEQLKASCSSDAQRGLVDAVGRLAAAACARAQSRLLLIDELMAQCAAFGTMQFGFLYEPARHLFAVGYNVDDRQRDVGYYDLLASEARLATFVTIAQGQIPQESWFALGRLLTSAGNRAVLVSWSGSMFEYLMPLLVMPNYENTLLAATCRAAVARQVAYGNQLGVPWGMSESGYNAVDASLNYQYRAFGVPGLGLKRGLGADVVVAPYATVLALMVSPEVACTNLRRLADDGMTGRFGYFEAVDYTPARLPPGESRVVIRSFMAHHQGMSLLAVAHLLLDQPMQKRFAADPLFQATLLLLQERIPKSMPLLPSAGEHSGTRATVGESSMPGRVIAAPAIAVPEVQLLSNGRYHVMVTHAGGSSSRWKDLAVTRWREDPTCDNWGAFCYIKDLSTRQFWSTCHQPTGAEGAHYEAIFSEGRAEFRRRDAGLDTHTEVVVSPEDDIELRRVRIVNRSRVRKVIELTSYAEIVLAPAASDASHPSFSNLFVETEVIEAERAIVCTRRPRSPGETPPWMFHLIGVHGRSLAEVSYETDRARFIGRGNTSANPQAMQDEKPLSGTAGAVLDPIVAIRARLALDPEQAATVDFVYGMAESRVAVMDLVAKYRDPRLADRVVELAWTHAQVVLRQINASEIDVRLYARLANSIVFANASLRADPDVLKRNRRAQSGLWGYAISGDLPIVLLRIAELSNLDLVRQLVQAHAYWRLKGLAVDLVIWNEDHGGYRQQLQDEIVALIAARVEAQLMDRPGGIFVRRGEQISEEDRGLLESVARVIISDRKGTLAEQIAGRPVIELQTPPFVPTLDAPVDSAVVQAEPPPLILENGLGGFSRDGKEYVITTYAGHLTPAPWVNVLANATFGTIVSESGGGYTWGENAHEFRLTPWSNDPVTDACGEAYYLRDEDTGAFWSPAPLPARGKSPYTTRHGFGYTVFEHTEHGIRSELWIFVAHDASVKFATLKLHNLSGRPRHISATGYVEWVLGDTRAKTMMHVITEKDSLTGALFARNAYSTEFGANVAFFDIDDTKRTVTCDRTEFIGRNGQLSAPLAMARTHLSGRTGPALDPCAAIAVTMQLDSDAGRELTFRLGTGRDGDDARALVQRFRGAAAVRAALDGVRSQWQHTLSAVQVETPDEALNVLANGWLVYQTLSCRVWARSGFYQSGGAFGFRDQLQDVLALVHAEPALTRAHLLLCASRQFIEGDVQHWWHPPAGRGVRTQCSDDYLWMPLATARYVRVTGDIGALDEMVGFLEGRPLKAGEDSYYDLPGGSSQVATLYEHCVRAILHGLRFGPHGLPLMGSGDWNDGMNLVGIEGRGESVWLAFFLCTVLDEFAVVARMRADLPFAQRCVDERSKLGRNIELHAWDGNWYRRAYFDDGTPLGSSLNPECQIDSISQSWSVLSGAGSAARSHAAIEAVYRRLVLPGAGLIELLTPPFDNSAHHPGYIRGYVPGVRENGGQYTHGAIWTVMAFAALGNAARAWELLDMINPLNHARTPAAAALYQVEPYVVSADVYALAPHTGRGGWSWYTGSAGWMYRLIVESLLGVQVAGHELRIRPCLPATWSQFTVDYRFGTSRYHVVVSQSTTSEHAACVRMDGILLGASTVPLVDDGLEHDVQIAVRPVTPRGH